MKFASICGGCFSGEPAASPPFEADPSATLNEHPPAQDMKIEIAEETDSETPVQDNTVESSTNQDDEIMNSIEKAVQTIPEDGYGRMLVRKELKRMAHTFASPYMVGQQPDIDNNENNENNVLVSSPEPSSDALEDYMRCIPSELQMTFRKELLLFAEDLASKWNNN